MLPVPLRIAAGIGILVGAFGVLSSLGSAQPLLGTRDQFVDEFQKRAQEQWEKIGNPDEIGRIAASLAEADFARRGTLLPMCAINLILSALLFAASTRVFQRSNWGWSTFRFTAALSLPFSLFEAAVAVLHSDEAQSVVATDDLGHKVAEALALRSQLSLAKCAIEIAYFSACFVYLQRSEVRRLFSDEEAT